MGLRGVLGALLVLLAASGAAAQATSTRPLLRVVTGLDAPFVQQPGSPVSGYSIEVWQEVARRLGADTTWTVLGDNSEEAQLAAVEEGRADLAVSALAVTAAREARLDFTMPYAESGLQILAARRSAGALDAWLDALASPAMGVLLLAGVVVLLVLAHLLWLVERRHDPAFRGPYPRVLAEALWGVALIIATGEHGDRSTPRQLKRLTIATFWLLGVVLVAQFTATVTATLTVDQLRSDIGGPGDLEGRRIAAAPGGIAAAWLDSRNLPFVPMTDIEQAYQKLLTGELQAVVHEAPQLRHWLAGRGTDRVALVGPMFRPEHYAMAVPTGSPLREQVNAALLAMQEDGTAESIAGRWFGRMR
jgi:ABC-type amino acid transport substrate-binding protein